MAAKWSDLFNGTNFVRRVLSQKFCHTFSFFFPWTCNWFAQCLHTCVSSLNPANMLHLQRVMVLLTLFLLSFHNTFFIARRLLLMSTGCFVGVHAWFVTIGHTVLASFSAHTTVLRRSFLDQVGLPVHDISAQLIQYVGRESVSCKSVWICTREAVQGDTIRGVPDVKGTIFVGHATCEGWSLQTPLQPGLV